MFMEVIEKVDDMIFVTVGLVDWLHHTGFYIRSIYLNVHFSDKIYLQMCNEIIILILGGRRKSYK